jgi:predicted amino acid dehydrogenase
LRKGEPEDWKGGKQAIGQLQAINAELAALLVELETFGLEKETAAVLRAGIRDALGTVRTLAPMIERLALLNDDRMRRASQLNADICQDLETGVIRTDQEALSTYLLVLNQSMEKVDRMFGGRKAKD